MSDLYLSMEEMHNYCRDMLKSIVDVCENENIRYYAIYGTLLGAIRHNGFIPWDSDVDLYVPENEINKFIHAIETKLGEKYWVDYRQDGIIPKPFPRVGLKGYDTGTLHIDIFRMSGLPDKKFKNRMLTKLGRSLYVLWKAKVINPMTYYHDVKKRIGAYLAKIIAIPFSVEQIINLIDYLCSKYEVFSTRYVGRVMGKGAIYEKKHFENFDMHDFENFQVRIPQNAVVLLSKMYGNYLQYPPKEYQDIMINKTFVIKKL